MKQLNNLTIGEFIDCDFYYKRNDICKIATYIYENSKDIDFHKKSYKSVIEAYNYYYDWLKQKHIEFPLLFIPVNDTYLEKKKKYDKLGLKMEDEEIKYDNRNKEYDNLFGWFDIILIEVCNNNFLDMNKAYQRNCIEIFNFLTRNRYKK